MRTPKISQESAFVAYRVSIDFFRRHIQGFDPIFGVTLLSLTRAKIHQFQSHLPLINVQTRCYLLFKHIPLQIWTLIYAVSTIKSWKGALKTFLYFFCFFRDCHVRYACSQSNQTNRFGGKLASYSFRKKTPIYSRSWLGVSENNKNWENTWFYWLVIANTCWKRKITYKFIERSSCRRLHSDFLRHKLTSASYPGYNGYGTIDTLDIRWLIFTNRA